METADGENGTVLLRSTLNPDLVLTVTGPEYDQFKKDVKDGIL